MAGHLSRSNILEELGLDASDAPEKVYAKFVHITVEQAMMPRKILIKSAQGIFKILASRGKIVGYQEPDVSEPVWVENPETEQQSLEELEARAGAGLEDGIISVSALEEKEREEVEKHQAPDVPLDSDGDLKPSGTVSPDVRKTSVKSSAPRAKKAAPKAKSSAPDNAVAVSPIIKSFYNSIEGKVQFACLVDGSGEIVSTTGASDVSNEALCKSMVPALETWNKATLDVLSDGPKMIISWGAASNDTAVIFVVDSNQYLLVEVEKRKFGVIAGLWNAARKTGSDA